MFVYQIITKSDEVLWGEHENYTEILIKSGACDLKCLRVWDNHELVTENYYK